MATSVKSPFRDQPASIRIGQVAPVSPFTQRSVVYGPSGFMIHIANRFTVAYPTGSGVHTMFDLWTFTQNTGLVPASSEAVGAGPIILNKIVLHMAENATIGSGGTTVTNFQIQFSMNPGSVEPAATAAEKFTNDNTGFSAGDFTSGVADYNEVTGTSNNCVVYLPAGPSEGGASPGNKHCSSREGGMFISPNTDWHLGMDVYYEASGGTGQPLSLPANIYIFGQECPPRIDL